MAHSVRNIIHKAYLVGMCSDNLGIEFLTVIFELKKTKFMVIFCKGTENGDDEWRLFFLTKIPLV